MLLVLPNVVGVTLYALVIGLLLEKLFSFFGSRFVSIWMRPWFNGSAQVVGSVASGIALVKRLSNYLPVIAKNGMKTWLGLPVLYVLSIIVSDERGAGEELQGLVSGYAWQETAIARVPLQTWLNLSHNSDLQIILSLIVAFFYANNVYVYYANGFWLAGEVRKTSNILLPIAVGSGVVDRNRERISARLKAQGWADEAVTSALFFLYMTNLRIVWKNPIFERIGPRGYGLFRAIISLGIIMGLKELHPLVAVLKVYFEKNDIGEIRRTITIYKKHLARLPVSIQATMDETRSTRAGGG